MTKTIEERLEYLERENEFQDELNIIITRNIMMMRDKILILEQRIEQLEEKE